MSAIEVRPLPLEECPRAAAIVASNALWTERYSYPPDRAAGDLAQAVSRGDLVLGAHGPALLGFAWVLPLGAFGRHPYLRLLAVDAAAHDRGVGALLLSAVEQRCAGARKMLLMVSDFNDGAQRFYQRHGYAQVGSCPDFVIDGVAELLFMKTLT